MPFDSEAKEGTASLVEHRILKPFQQFRLKQWRISQHQEPRSWISCPYLDGGRQRETYLKFI